MSTDHIIAKDTSVIPKGLYCYRHTGKMVTVDKAFVGGELKQVETYEVPDIQRCPYWSMHKDQPDQMNGHCSFLEFGDWEAEGLSLLWDQVKECGINDEDEDENQE